MLDIDVSLVLQGSDFVIAHCCDFVGLGISCVHNVYTCYVIVRLQEEGSN